MWLAAGCPLRQERRTNYFFLSFIQKSDLSSSGKCNYQATVSFLFWQVVLYSTQVWGKVLMVQHRNLHAFLNMNIHLISNLKRWDTKETSLPPTHAHLSEASINCQYILYKNNSRETRSGKTLVPFNIHCENKLLQISPIPGSPFVPVFTQVWEHRYANIISTVMESLFCCLAN